MSSTGPTVRYWQLYRAWEAALREAETAMHPRARREAEARAADLKEKLRAHVAVHGHWTELIGGKWSPMDEEHIQDEKAGGWDVQN